MGWHPWYLDPVQAEEVAHANYIFYLEQEEKMERKKKESKAHPQVTDKPRIDPFPRKLHIAGRTRSYSHEERFKTFKHT